MDATISITCPDCKKSLKGPPELLGKKVRCKSCGHVFVVDKSRSSAEATPNPAVASKAPSAKSTLKGSSSSSSTKTKGSSADTKPTKSEAPPRHDEETSNPYKLSDEVHLAARCPQCAAGMEEGAVICLECGYNTETRTRLQMVKTYDTTPADRTMWLLPGILCALTALICIGLITYMWIAWWGRDDWWAFPLKVWGGVMLAGISWVCGRFGYHRLIANPNPPEVQKR
jgi:rubredoxin